MARSRWWVEDPTPLGWFLSKWNQASFQGGVIRAGFGLERWRYRHEFADRSLGYFTQTCADSDRTQPRSATPFDAKILPILARGIWRRRSAVDRKWAGIWRRFVDKNPELRMTSYERRRRREREAPGKKYHERRIELLYRWQTEGRPCWACGGPCESVDHTIPLSRGGSNFEGNLAPACRICNSSRNSKLAIEWKYRPSPTITWAVGPHRPRRKITQRCRACGVVFTSETEQYYCQPRRCPDAPPRPIKLCKFIGCENRRVCHGYCEGHRQQLERGSPLKPLQVFEPRVGNCMEDGCDNPVRARRKCMKHYTQEWKARKSRPLDQE